MGRLFNDGFTSYDLDHCGLLVVSIISSILGVCIMKVGQCILIKPMHIDMLLKGGEQLEFIN